MGKGSTSYNYSHEIHTIILGQFQQSLPLPVVLDVFHFFIFSCLKVFWGKEEGADRLIIQRKNFKNDRKWKKVKRLGLDKILQKVKWGNFWKRALLCCTDVIISFYIRLELSLDRFPVFLIYAKCKACHFVQYLQQNLIIEHQ